MGRVRRGLVAVLLGASALGGCGLTASLDGLTGGDPGADDAAQTDATLEASPDGATEGSASDALPGDAAATDAGPDARAPATPVAIADAGAVMAPTGNAQQAHLVYAASSQQWWLFYVDATDPLVMKTQFTSDFSAWTGAGSLTLPDPPGDGRQFVATAAVLAGGDVAHVAVSTLGSTMLYTHLHVRGRLAAGSVQFDPTVILGSITQNVTNLAPDGPATAVLGDDTIAEMTSWLSEPDGGAYGNAYAFRSTGPDPGGAFTPAFGPFAKLEQVPQYVNAHALVPVAGAAVWAFWESGDAEPDPSNVHFASFTGGTWSVAASVFKPATQDPNDWGVCALGGQIHAVRRLASGAWEHRLYGGSAFTDGGAIPPLDALAGSGVVVLCDGSAHVHVFAIAVGAGNPIRSTAWNGSVWSAWADVVVPGSARSWLTGAINAPGDIGLVWTEGTGAAQRIVGAFLPH